MVAKLDGTNGLLQQYDYQAPTTGFSYTFAAGVNVLVMNPAGTLATGTITMPASPADGMTISFSSTQTITALTVNANTGQSIVRKPTSFGAGSAMTFVYRLSNTTWYPMTNYATAGTVLQTVATTFTSEFSWTTKGAWVDMTGISASITPTSATSQIMVFLMLSTGDGGNNYERAYRVLRGSSVIAEGPNTASIMVRAQAATGMGAYASNASIVTIPIMVIDSPATTSSTTYKLQGWASASSVTTSYINRPYAPTTSSSPTGISTITLMEIAA